PLPAGHPLAALDNVVLTPHLGFVTHEAYDVFFRSAVDNILRWLDGGVPERTLNPEARPQGR
ncbi:MAG: D-2-hydroxyacid dehydrogenase family protein, partial [Candidatus Rokubacteria bacterium]|nr:D-2-hydroxyacid dehydrogenase family protein [Candidatus Rokubacteria bacterium]